MYKKNSRVQVKEEINKFFSEIKSKTPRNIKKIKKLAMSRNIKLGKKRRLFCKKCLIPYKSPKIRIKNKTKRITCQNCGYINRWKIINSS